MRRRGAYVVGRSPVGLGLRVGDADHDGGQRADPQGGWAARAAPRPRMAAPTRAPRPPRPRSSPTAADGGTAGAAGGKVTLGDAGAPPSVAVATGGPSAPMDGATYAVRLRDLEGRVDELKDQIRRSHTRLALLSDTILSGGAAGSRAEVGLRRRDVERLQAGEGRLRHRRHRPVQPSDETGALADQEEHPHLQRLDPRRATTRCRCS